MDPAVVEREEVEFLVGHGQREAATVGQLSCSKVGLVMQLSRIL